MSIALMTKPDPTLKDFYEDMDRCADLINVICFNGEEIVKSNHIYKESVEESTLFEERDFIISFHSYRDIMIRYTDKGYFILIGIENQQSIDFFIALREFLYTAFNYNRQYRNYQRECRKRKGRELEKKEFKLTPVMTPVLYFGEEEWKEHHYLSDIMNVVPNMWKSIINDWYTRVIDIKKIDTTLFRNKDNKDLFEGILKIYNAKGKSDEIKDLKVTKEVAVLISTITGMKDLVNIIMEQESEEIDMCRSWELFKENEIRIPLEREIKRVREEGRIAVEKELKLAVEKELKLAVEKELHETKATIIITILNDKLGGLSKELQQHLKEISIEKLNIITKQILHIENEQDILSLTN